MKFEIRNEVKKRYGEIASKIDGQTDSSPGCGSSCCCGTVDKSQIGYTDANVSGLPEKALSASLGCANPLLFAELKPGETVLDLGSGGGIDVLAASKYVGGEGQVYGLDMTDEMIELANRNKTAMGVENVTFLKGYIEAIPLADESIDVILSNCVVNLSEDKEKALSEAYRVLKKGGRFAIADIVSLKTVSPVLSEKAALWCGCLTGALAVDDYRKTLASVGFRDIEIEPVHVYTKAVLEAMYGEHLDVFKDLDPEEADGTFAGAHIKAIK